MTTALAHNTKNTIFNPGRLRLANPNPSTVAIGILLGAAAIGGGAWLWKQHAGTSTPKKTDVPKTPPLHTNVYQDENGAWWFAALENGQVVYGPDGPYAEQTVALLAAQNWITANAPTA